MVKMTVEERTVLADTIRQSGIEFHLSPASRYQKDLLEADIVKMVEENMDILLDAIDDGQSDIDVKTVFSR